MDGRISNLEQVASLRRYTLTDGRGKGLDVIDCDNGKIRFLLNVSKALDMMQLYCDGKNMTFISKNGFIKRELPFADRFEGGMVYTCGLDSAGEREGFDEHGSFHNIPAEVIRAECNESEIVVEAIIRDTRMGGKNLVFRRRVSTRLGSDTVSVRDRLTNEGYSDEPYCILYHVNIGYPMLSDGARIVAEAEECTPRTEWAEKNLDSAFRIASPEIGMEEVCYYLKVRKPVVSLVNEKIGKKFTVSYSGDTLPHFLAWKNMTCGDYAVGLEPCNTKLDGLFEYSRIQAGETVEFSLDLSVKDLPAKGSDRRKEYGLDPCGKLC